MTIHFASGSNTSLITKKVLLLLVISPSGRTYALFLGNMIVASTPYHGPRFMAELPVLAVTIPSKCSPRYVIMKGGEVTQVCFND